MNLWQAWRARRKIKRAKDAAIHPVWWVRWWIRWEAFKNADVYYELGEYDQLGWQASKDAEFERAKQAVLSRYKKLSDVHEDDDQRGGLTQVLDDMSREVIE